MPRRIVPLSAAPWLEAASLKASAARTASRAKGSRASPREVTRTRRVVRSTSSPADALLQCGDGLGQAGLADSERGGGLAEVLVVAQRYERPQLGEGRR